MANVESIAMATGSFAGTEKYHTIFDCFTLPLEAGEECLRGKENSGSPSPC